MSVRLVLLLLAGAATAQQPAEPSPTFAISGHVIDSHGRPSTDLTVWIAYSDEDGERAEGSPVNPDGTFLISNVKPRRYLLVAAPPVDPNGVPPVGEGGTLEVTVTNADLHD